MKSFLTSTKGKIVAGIGTVGVIAIVIAVILGSNRGYRTIAVEELNGATIVTNSKGANNAYVGQHLSSGDDVNVTTQSDLTLALDSDKYVYAKENTHFWVEAQGKTNDTRTVIKLDEGSVLSRIDNKLAANESFEVGTPNATMSVRGTVFKVETYTDETGETYTVVDVFEGAVFVQVHEESGANTEENRVVNAGERAVVHSNKSISEFVKGEQEDEIVYGELTQNEALFLGKAIDEGRNLSIGKELLYDIVELTPHDFSGRGEEVEPTCTEEGYYYDVCVVCGALGEMHTVAKLSHEVNGDDNICTICGEEVEALENAEADDNQTSEDGSDKNTSEKCKDGHTYESEKVAATCTQDGYTQDKCSVCGEIANKAVIPATGHKLVDSKVAPTCTEDGYESSICSVCGEGTTTKLPLLGHEFVTDHTDATCTSEGMDSVICNRCGAGSVTSIPAKGHTEGSPVSDGMGNGHHVSCTTCGTVIRSGSHTYPTDAFGTVTGHCTVCGEGY